MDFLNDLITLVSIQRIKSIFFQIELRVHKIKYVAEGQGISQSLSFH